jgi:hypothetical protein
MLGDDRKNKKNEFMQKLIANKNREMFAIIQFRILVVLFTHSRIFSGQTAPYR